MADSKSDLLMKFTGPAGDLAASGQAAIDRNDPMLEGFQPGKYFELDTFDFSVELNDFESDDKGTSAPSRKWVVGGKFANWRTPRDDGKPPQIAYPVEMDEFSFTRLIDEASPIIFQNCANSVGFKQAVLVKRRPAYAGTLSTGRGGTHVVSGLRGFLRIEFTEILITGLSWDDGEMVKEKCKFMCRSMFVRYSPQTSSGVLTTAAETTAQWKQSMELRTPTNPSPQG